MERKTLEQTVARLYAGMTPEQIADHQDWVRRFTTSEAGKAATAAREAERIRREWAYEKSDEEVLAEAVAIVQSGEGLAAGVRSLREARFERGD